MTFEEELITILNQIPGAIEKAFTAFVERHPGHANQKTHGNRFGAGQAKESLRRLKDDKGAREKYKATSRQRRGVESKPVRTPGKMGPKTTYGETEFSKPATYSGRKRVTAKREGKTGDEWAGSMKLELNETGKGTGIFSIDNPQEMIPTEYGGRVKDALVRGKPLKEAKKIAKIILDNTDFNKPSWEDKPDFTSKKVRQALKNAGYPVKVD